MIISNVKFSNFYKPLGGAIRSSVNLGGNFGLQNKNENYCDTVSFGTKKITYNFLLADKSDILPERVQGYLQSRIDNGDGYEQTNIYDVHQEVYADLKNAKTLDEAKALYPEFADVKETDALPDRAFYNKGRLAELMNNEDSIEGGASLYLLKCAYLVEDDKKIKKSSLEAVAKKLNIPLLKSDYSRKVKSNSPQNREGNKERAVERWSDAAFKAKMKEIVSNADFKKRISTTQKAQWQDSEYKQHMSELLSERWKNPEYRAKMDTPELREKRRINAIEMMKNPEMLQRQSETHKRLWEDEDYRSKMIAKLNSPEVNEASSTAAKARWATPEYREKFTATRSTPEFVAKLSENTRKRWENNPEERRRFSQAMTMAWEQVPEVREYSKKLREENPLIKVILAKAGSGEELSAYEINILKAYDKEIWAHGNNAEVFSQALKNAHQQLKKIDQEN